MTCERCARPGADFSAEHDAVLCAQCFFADAPKSPSPASSRSAVPCPSSLVPCATGVSDDDEPEVEALLRLHADGAFEPTRVDLPDLPGEATAPMRKVAEFYALVRGLRLAAGDDRDVPFATRWVAAKLDLSHRTVARALRQLAEHDVLVSSGTMPGRGGRGTNLYTPGQAQHADVLPFPISRRAAS